MTINHAVSQRDQSYGIRSHGSRPSSDRRGSAEQAPSNAVVDATELFVRRRQLVARQQRVDRRFVRATRRLCGQSARWLIGMAAQQHSPQHHSTQHHSTQHHPTGQSPSLQRAELARRHALRVEIAAERERHARLLLRYAVR
ncbi:hypothetical protein GCM10027169_26200 [Gordonia jinhuaensis]|uniref:Uncharacterized protein n=1 Tax=Gordonia jinhuaensis TaxID=1517702 RepID=A0A916TAU0_9ACTN|nr:hypothetical protein [Gordonia jinhuaensis]GGB38214.1 hypothetical protein GCM10011489_27380 [Gordonia jinhuaensis]